MCRRDPESLGERTLRAEIVSIGNEVLSGHTVNTNAAYLARELSSIGVEPTWVTTIGDDPACIGDAFATARRRAEIVVTTGGIGPTHDDITREIFCETFSRTLVRDEGVLDNIKALFAARGRQLTDRNIDQAMVPCGTEVLMNRWGTAPGIHLADGPMHWFMLPGVPREMQNLVQQAVLPRIRALVPGVEIVRRELHVTGIPESNLMDQIADIVGISHVASLPDARGEVSLRITIAAASLAAARAGCAAIEKRLRDRLGAAVYGADDETLESAVGDLLKQKRMSIAVAESCTGGLVTSRLTDVAGSSAYVVTSVVAYANEAKQELLGVPASTLNTYGAVSPQTAAAMAEGVRKLARTSVGLSLTGIAGPAGGSAEKPVGLVFIAIADSTGTSVSRHLFGDDRLLTKQRAAQTALDIVRRRLIRGGDSGAAVA